MYCAGFCINKLLKPKVFIFDDETLFTKSFSNNLRRFGLNVHSATTKKRAIELVNNNDYDSYLVDIEAPWDKNFGIFLLEKIKSKNANALIEVITAHKHYRKELANFGIDAFSDKPIIDQKTFAFALKERIYKKACPPQEDSSITKYIVEAAHILHNDQETKQIILNIFGKELPEIADKVKELQALGERANKLLLSSKNTIALAHELAEED